MAGAAVKLEGDHVLIRIPVEDIQALRVALEPCGCVASKSNPTMERRKALVRALGTVLVKIAQRKRG